MAEKLKHFHDMNIDQILAEKRKSEAIIRSVDDGLVVVDEKLLITNINPKATTIFGVDPEEALGKHILEVVRDEQIFQGFESLPGIRSTTPPGRRGGYFDGPAR